MKNYTISFLCLLFSTALAVSDTTCKTENAYIQLAHFFKAEDAQSRPLAWDTTGKRIFTSWAQDGISIGIIEIASGKVTELKGKSTIEALAYKNDGPDGFVSQSKNDLRLWNLSNQTSKEIIVKDMLAQIHCVAMNPTSDLWGVIYNPKNDFMSQNNGLCVLNGEHIQEHWMTTHSPSLSWQFNGVSAIANTPSFLIDIYQDQVNPSTRTQYKGCIYDAAQKKIIRTVQMKNQAQSGSNMVYLKMVRDTIYGGAYYCTYDGIVRSCLMQWGPHDEFGTSHTITINNNAKWMMLNAMDANESYVVAGYSAPVKQSDPFGATYYRISLYSRTNLSTPLTTIRLSDELLGLSISFNPANQNQFAVGTKNGIYIYDVIPYSAETKETAHEERNKKVHQECRANGISVTVSPEAQWKLQLDKQIELGGALYTRQVTWNSNGTTLYSTSGYDQDLVVLDSNKGIITTIPGEKSSKPIVGIAYKNDGPQGLATTNYDVGDGAAEVRLWNIAGKTSTPIKPIAGMAYLTQIVSGVDDTWGIAQFEYANAGGPPGAMYVLNGPDLEWFSKASYSTVGSVSYDGGKFAFSKEMNSYPECVIVHYPHTKTTQTLKLNDFANYYLMGIKCCNNSIFAIGWTGHIGHYVIFLAEWKPGQEVATVQTIGSDAYPSENIFDINSKYMVYGVGMDGAGTLLFFDNGDLKAPLCTLTTTIPNQFHSVAFNPQNDKQFAVATDNGVSIYSLVYSDGPVKKKCSQQIRFNKKPAVAELYQSFYGHPR